MKRPNAEKRRCRPEKARESKKGRRNKPGRTEKMKAKIVDAGEPQVKVEVAKPKTGTSSRNRRKQPIEKP